MDLDQPAASPTEPLSPSGEQVYQALAGLQKDLAELAYEADLDGFQRCLIQGTSRVLNSDAAILVLADEDNPGWLIYKTLDGEAKWALHLQTDEGKGPVSECFKDGSTIILEGEQAQISFDPTCTGDSLLQARSLLCAPLQSVGRTLGVLLVLNKRDGGYVDADRRTLNSLASAAASGLQTGRLIQQYRISRASLEADRWELLASHNFLSALFDHLPTSIYIIDQDYNLLAVNKSRLQQTGVSTADLVGQVCFRALFGRSEPCLDCRVRETLLTGEVMQRNDRRRNSGNELTEWEVSAYPIRNDQGKPVQAILLETDVTEKRRLEAILTQSEKLAAVGQLAAGVAHEINNPLTAIIANAQILHRDLPPDSDMQESVDLILRAGARAAQVVRNLLDFARKEDYRLRRTDINETLELALELVRHELVARNVVLEMDLDPGLPTILASADHLQGVWLNLLLNAIDSLDKSPPKIGIASRKVDGELHVTISDNGKGILAENIDRIFEPFFTTKAPGRGTGLGLSVSQRIVKQHAGYFRVESQAGEGSAFTVVLPAK
jgi:two-component system NtrC family sensor kinase